MTILLIEHMDSKYRELLRDARGGDDKVHPLYPTSWFYEELAVMPETDAISVSKPEPLKTEHTSITAEVKLEKAETSSTDKVTEKIRILDSLNLFSEEKLEGKDSFGFKGGEIARKELNSSSQSNSLSFNKKDISFLKNEFKQSLSHDAYSIKINSLKHLDRSKFKVFFVTDSYLRGELNSPEDSDSALKLYFEGSVVQLFDRMIKAMKLEYNQYYVSAISLNDQNREELILNEISMANPELIISLGAVSTNFLTGDSERLKDIHGTMRNIKVMDIENNDQTKSFKVMPLFSPTLLLTAPNMKKTAWKDMQKAMELLGLSNS